jgi:hypothetical protein
MTDLSNLLESQTQNLKLTTHNLLNAWFQPMGFLLYLVSNSQAIIEAAQTSFGRFGRPDKRDSPDFTFRLFEHNLDDGRPGEPVFRLEGDLLYQTTGRDSTLVAGLNQGFAFGHFSATTLANPAHFRWHFLELAFFMMLEARGLMGVHGAALAKKGQAILLRGASGSGKTTLAYAAARRRFQALAEDVVWLDNRREVWWGMPWSFHLLPDTRQLFPELEPYSPILQTNGELKLEVNLENIRPGSTVFTAQPGAVVFLERAHGEKSRLEKINAAEAQQLWPAARTGLEMKLPHHDKHIEALLRQNCYRLYNGDDIEGGVDLLERLFD